MFDPWAPGCFDTGDVAGIIGPVVPQLFDIPRITLGELIKAVDAAGSNAIGPDLISRKMIMIALPICARMILHIFNFSIANCIFPQSWKDAFVRPIPKVNRPSVCSDYRPIALTCYMSKLLEKIVSKNLINYMEAGSHFNRLQSSFRSGMSTQTALINVLDDVRWALDNKDLTVMVFFDFSKAFETIEHKVLINKLRHCGLSDASCRWVSSYLSGRRQCVRDDEGQTSVWVEMTRGVPQGTIFGPLFFIAYTADLPSVLKRSKYMVFADDVEIYLSCAREELDDTISALNDDVRAVCKWSKTNFMTLNPNKTQAIVIGPPRIIKSIDLHLIPKIMVESSEVEFSSEVKNLGVWISEDLSWGSHLSHVRTKVYSSLRQLKKAANCLSWGMRRYLVRALILPHVDYCSLLLLGCPKYIENEIKRLYNCCIRFVCNIHGPESISLHYIKLDWLMPHYQRLYFLGKMTFYLINLNRSHYLAERLVFSSDSSTRPSRASTLDLKIKFAKTDSGLETFEVAASRFWNEIPETIRKADKMASFSNKLRTWLLERQKTEIISF